MEEGRSGVSVSGGLPRLAAVVVRCLGAVAVAVWLTWLVGWLVEREQSLDTERGGGSNAGAQVYFQARSPAALQPLMCETAGGGRGSGQGRGPEVPFLGEQWGRPGKLRLVAWWIPPPQPMTGAVTAGVSRFGASKNRRAFQSTSQLGRGD